MWTDDWQTDGRMDNGRWVITIAHSEHFVLRWAKIAGNQHFLLFPQCFLLFPMQISIFESLLFCCLQMLWIWTSLKFCHLVKCKLFTKWQNCRPVWFESICRLQNFCYRKTEICFGKGRKHYGKSWNCWLPAFFPFPIMFSKGSFFKVVKSQGYVVKS